MERRLGAGLQPEDKTSKVWEGSIEVPGNATNKLGVVAKKADVYLILELWKEIPERVVELFIAWYYFWT